MADTLLPDNPQAVQRLDSVACLLEWTRSMPVLTRKRFFGALAECSDAVQQVVDRLSVVVKNPQTTPVERQRALTTIANALFGNADEKGAYGLDLTTPEAEAAAKHPLLARKVQKLDTQQATFAQRLRDVMDAKRVSQLELAERIGCSQPAISQMLNRDCRPQKKTILKLAAALNVQAGDLWPDLEVVEMLDAVASFQHDDYVMTDAEARALGETSRPNRPKMQAKSLPTRRR